MHKLNGAQKRKAGYALATLAGTIFALFGIISAEQLDGWQDILETLSPILWPIATGVATAKTHQGSDDPTTREDVQLAYQTAQPTYIPVQEQFTQAVDNARQSVDDALESARAAYRDATRRD